MIKVNAASDDQIEISGDIDEAFYANGDDKQNILVFSDGTILSITYTVEGMWRINRLVKGVAGYSKEEADDEETNYSDKVILEGHIDWVVFGSEYIKA
jgi:hypothetical protein